MNCRRSSKSRIIGGGWMTISRLQCTWIVSLEDAPAVESLDLWISTSLHRILESISFGLESRAESLSTSFSQRSVRNELHPSRSCTAPEFSSTAHRLHTILMSTTFQKRAEGCTTPMPFPVPTRMSWDYRNQTGRREKAQDVPEAKRSTIKSP